MNRAEIIYDLAGILGCEARREEPLSRHTTFKIGGSADVYIKVKNYSQLTSVLRECRESDVDYLILGNGSNVLASDDGYRGVVIRLDGDFRKISLLDDTTVYCGAGATLASLCKFALNNGLSGLEFAWGIPGTAYRTSTRAVTSEEPTATICRWVTVPAFTALTAASSPA